MNKKMHYLLFYLLSIIYTSLIFIVADTSLGFNTIKLSNSLHSIAYTISPQGWGFFTRNPREPLVDFYRVDINNLNLNKVTIKNASIENQWGFSRMMRVSSSEIGYIKDQIPEHEWMSVTEFNREYINVLLSNSYPYKINNDFTWPIFCGMFLMTKTDRIPWAWSKHRGSIKMPKRIALVEVICNK